MLKKKLLSILLAIAVCVSTMAFTASAVGTTCDNGPVTDGVENPGPFSNSVLATWNTASALRGQEQWFFLDYLSKQSGWYQGYDIIAQAGWLYNPTFGRMYSWESPRSIQKKIDYINKKNLGGTIVWDTSGDNLSSFAMFNNMKALKDAGKEVIAYYGNWEVYGDQSASGEHVQGQDETTIPWNQITTLNYSFFAISDGLTHHSTEAGNTSAWVQNKVVPKYKIVTTDMSIDFSWKESDTPSKDVWDSGGSNGMSNAMAGVGARYGLDAMAWMDYFGYYNFGQLEDFNKISQEKGVDIMLSVGGWTRSEMFSEMASSQANRSVFIESCVQFLKDYPNFDGIDLDWEYPGADREPEDNSDRGNHVYTTPEADRTNFVSLVQEMRTRFNQEWGTGATRKRLTACSSVDHAPQWDAVEQKYTTPKLTWFDAAAMYSSLDSINIMSYDMAGAGWSNPGYGTQLYSDESSEWATANAVEHFLSQGVPSQKIMVGTPLYGPGWSGITRNTTNIPSTKYIPTQLPYPQVSGLKGNNIVVNTNITKDLDIKYTFYDNSERTPEQVHEPVAYQIVSGSQYIQVITDPNTGKLSVKGVAPGTARLKVTEALDSLASEEFTVTVIGEVEPLVLTSVTATKSGNNYNVTAVAAGGVDPYVYYAYVLKDGKVWYKLLESGTPNFSFTPTESGTYKVVVYVRDQQRSQAKNQTTFTF
ncbi:MAG: hypothetical protein LBS74_08780 [Oscillospiraceae bacterium]|jgi:GH18 family chitinase|nr:hypothetical protein [Oscillospiraceae bacterium]